jgi:hypothetical protein
MKTKQFLIKSLITLVVFSCLLISVQGTANPGPTENAQAKAKPGKVIKNQDKLVVLWTSGDREVALKMVFMYTLNSKKFGWWEDITLVVWGPSAKLLAEDKELQDYIKKIKEAGVVFKAFKGCADLYGFSKKLEDLGIIVKYMGELTNYIKEGRNILTF